MSKSQSQYRSARLTIHKLLPTVLTGWSLALLAGSVAGMVYMALYMKTRSLPAIILSHFVVDLISFSRIVPAGLLVLM